MSLTVKTTFTSKEVSILIGIAAAYAPFPDADPDVNAVVEKCKAHVEPSNKRGATYVPPFSVEGPPA